MQFFNAATIGKHKNHSRNAISGTVLLPFNVKRAINVEASRISVYILCAYCLCLVLSGFVMLWNWRNSSNIWRDSPLHMVAQIAVSVFKLFDNGSFKVE